MFADLDMLDADVLGDSGDDFLRQHAEIPRSADGRPLRGMLVPVSAAEKAAYLKEFGKPADAVAYQGPSLADLRKRDPGTWNAVERYWAALMEGNVAQVDLLKQQARLAADALNLASGERFEAVRANTYRDLADKFKSEDEGPLAALMKTLRDAGDYLKIGAAVAGVGAVVAVGAKLFLWSRR